ncbi:mitochondrial outer membrane protein porin 2-like [Durio zibethinus]|uniref:Mitochondrial outer membrane protein porin 2-like n=1 Tax=Durio zibethinus TaxID=66656 RepID=A0A6P6AF68_DURZI|nr:mitochondrial outer membrane protein porin 2-like [Durio zibethinus]
MGNSHQRKKKRKNTSKRHKQEAGSSGPRLLSEFERIANDLLRKGYSLDKTLSISTHSCNGVILTSRAVKQGRGSSTNIGARYKYRNAAIDVNFNTKSSVSTTLTLGGEFLPSTNIKASVRFPDYNSSKLNLQFPHLCRNAALSISVGLSQSPDVMLSATMGTSSIAFGMELKYKTASHRFTQYDAGISVTKPSCNASIILCVASLEIANTMKKSTLFIIKICKG